MVHVVVVGGAGNVGREIVEELVAQAKHEVTVFSRKELPELSKAGIQTRKVNYLDKTELAAELKEVHTVLSFVSSDPDNIAQRNLIDACIEAGVKRFAPSEWGIISNSGFAGYAFKDQVHEYLKQVNAEKTVLEYSLFQTGFFMNYLGFPHKTAKHLFITCVFADFDKGHALQVEDGDYWVVHTTIQDVAKVVARAVDYPGKWPEVGGMIGSRIKMKDLIKLAEKIRGTKPQEPAQQLPTKSYRTAIRKLTTCDAGEPIEVHTVKKADLEKHQLNVTWVPQFQHPNMPTGIPNADVLIAAALSVCAGGGFDVSSEWNELLPDMKFTDTEEFLTDVFGK
ncbi:hypothetical protein FQN54_003653 [Arachnomyces sp. PD_36]|nr:hypothetical protein FQN54_003653 [Arachnomyces sp. PD_36]